MKIRIFDDDSKQRQAFADMVTELDLPKEEFDIGVLSEDEFDEILANMKERQRLFREQGYWAQDNSNHLDDVNILVVDFDLFEAKGVMDADQIAYLTRCFTTCGVIVVMNRVSHNFFDLTLKGQVHAFSDVEIGQNQLNSSSLWGIKKDNFSPWYWPVLPDLVNDFERRVDDIEKALEENQSIRNLFGFSDENWQWLPKGARQFLGADDILQNILETSPFMLNPRDREGLQDPSQYIKNVSRLVAARLSKWLENLVLPELDILVDAPHLAVRFPSLVEAKHDEINSWNDLTVRHSNDIDGFQTEVIKQYQFEKYYWLSRPVWFWRDLMMCNDIPEVNEPWNIEPVKWVFCEDTSTFELESKCSPFKAETISPFASRYVKKIDGITYLPVQRFAL